MARKYIFTIIIVLFCIESPINAQFSIRKKMTSRSLPDSVDINYYAKKNWGHAFGTVVGLNLGIWGFDRFVTKSDFAYINIHTIKNNITKGFVWDNDQMGTNMFLHPYHGNLYYNSARSNGFNFWQSGLFAFAGSSMWELFMENERPSKNDIMATPVGGVAVGEVLYRISDLVLDDRATGANRFGREFASFLISPTKAISRILTGDAWKRRATSGKQFGIPEVGLEIGLGSHVTELKDNIFDKGVGLALDINLEYGDRYATENEHPFDYFTMRTNFNILGSQPFLSQINIMGRLHVIDLVDNNKNFLSLGAYQHFDYFDSDTISEKSGKVPYKIGVPASMGVGLIFQNKRFPDWKINASLHANAILLGASLSDHYLVDKRNYNLGSGFSVKSSLNVSYKNKIGVTARYEAYRLFTWKGYPSTIDWSNVDEKNLDAQGDVSQAILHVLSLQAEVKLKKNLYLTAIGYNYIRDTNYKYYDDVHSQTSEGRLLLTYKF